MSTKINAELLLQRLKQNREPMLKKEIAKSFGLKGDERREMKDAIRELMDSGLIEKTVSKAYTVAGQETIPAVSVFEVTDVTTDGEIYAIPVDNAVLQMQIKDPIIIEA
jgi:ribonuclease R